MSLSTYYPLAAQHNAIMQLNEKMPFVFQLQNQLYKKGYENIVIYQDLLNKCNQICQTYEQQQDQLTKTLNQVPDDIKNRCKRYEQALQTVTDSLHKYHEKIEAQKQNISQCIENHKNEREILKNQQMNIQQRLEQFNVQEYQECLDWLKKEQQNIKDLTSRLQHKIEQQHVDDLMFKIEGLQRNLDQVKQDFEQKNQQFMNDVTNHRKIYTQVQHINSKINDLIIPDFVISQLETHKQLKKDAGKAINEYKEIQRIFYAKDANTQSDVTKKDPQTIADECLKQYDKQIAKVNEQNEKYISLNVQMSTDMNSIDAMERKMNNAAQNYEKISTMQNEKVQQNQQTINSIDKQIQQLLFDLAKKEKEQGEGMEGIQTYMPQNEVNIKLSQLDIICSQFASEIQEVDEQIKNLAEQHELIDTFMRGCNMQQ